MISFFTYFFQNVSFHGNFLESGRLVKLIAKLKKIAMERDILKKVSKKTNHRKKINKVKRPYYMKQL